MPVAAVADDDVIAEGRALFEDGDRGCLSCHVKRARGATADIGRGEFKIPTLAGIRYRAPFMHDGCAQTLRDRFTPECGGKQHGGTFTEGEKDALVRYLETL